MDADNYYVNEYTYLSKFAHSIVNTFKVNYIVQDGPKILQFTLSGSSPSIVFVLLLFFLIVYCP